MSTPRTEFKSLDEMSEAELAEERRQTWSIVKSDTTWWIYRNHGPFMRAASEAEAVATLQEYGITCDEVDKRQRALTEQDWNEYRRDKMRVLSGSGPSLARRVWRWFGGDAA